MTTKPLIWALAVFAVMGASLAQAADNLQVLLKLERLEDETITHTVVLYGNSIDPNRQSVDDVFRLEIDGKKVAMPGGLLSDLAIARRAYSYDELSGGIAESSGGLARCMLGGPANGDRLSTLYLTYTDYKITDSNLRPVLTEAGNCLFKLEIRPKDADAARSAVKALTTLQVLLELQRK